MRKPKIFTDDPDALAAARSCGQCTACCTCPTLSVPERKKLNAACAHLRCGRAKKRRPGCSIYPARPQLCENYACYWRRGLLGPHERPDRLGVIFDTSAWPRLAEVMNAAGTPIVLAREVYPGSSKSTAAKAAILVMTESFGVIRVGVPGVQGGIVVHAMNKKTADKIHEAIEQVGAENPSRQDARS